ncbi:glycerol kinase GlpK [Mesomycoplasma lagogenitalium]|uniref:Glycerol kinase n=1 Tax=Mesomycoplasma lagogenitalium TaxID=171286 RepID=A0ABY8LXI9_9BACT|nr:glycerol kinase GlpK [Mesomycoplasma lagogenitalium]WGI36986.1 glycerol kinase GlpK [Mesomycoplasma lagogenitalium]
MKDKYIITLDSGTTSCRSLVVDHGGNIVASSQTEFTQYFPNSGWVEHDPLEIWNTQLSTMQSAKHKAKIKSTDIVGLGITNQRETVVLWDKETGLPVYNAIVWQDRRTSEYCETLTSQSGLAEKIADKTGLIINPYFSGTKIRWILKNVPEAQQKLKEHKLLAGTIDTWLMWKLTDGKVHATDVSNASRTLLYNIHTLDWDQEILDLLEIPREILPEVKASSEHYGYVSPHYWSNKAVGKVPITGVAGDQQSALFGQLCTEVGMVKNTYGTGCFTLVNTGTTAVKSKNKLLTTIAWKLGKEKVVYALEGSVFVAGAALQWLRDSIRILYNAAESDFFASLVKDDQRVYVVPSFTGLGAPYWDSYSRGAIFGLERGTKREHLIKATLDSIAYQSNDLIKAMEKDLEKPIILLKVDGGASNSNYLMQFQSSISNLKVERPSNIETTALGASYLAGLAVGYWKDVEELKKINSSNKVFEPQLSQAEIDKLIKGWNTAVKKTLNWTKDIE